MRSTPFKLSARERQSLAAVCDTLIPSFEREGPLADYWARRATDRGLVERVEEVIGLQAPYRQREFHRLMSLLASPLAPASARGPFRPFDRLSAPEREQALQRWSAHPLPQFRQGFQALKRLICFLYYSDADDAGNPNWSAIGYPGAPSSPLPAAPPAIQPFDPGTQPRLECDTVVVGSGAGGGVVAGLLTEAGQDVIVVEKGPYRSGAALTQREAETMATLYEASGTLATEDLGVVLLAGSCLGGGTTVNWAGAFRTPEHILDEWATEHLLPHLRTPAYQAAQDAVERRSHVTVDESPCNPQNRLLLEAARARGIHAATIPRNVIGCDHDECGFCAFGCRRGAKQSTVTSYLAAAHARGMRILVESTARRVLVQQGRAAGVEVERWVETANGVERRTLTIQARRVVVAAGAIHTPALLRRSGLTHPHIGRHLYLHPTVAVAGIYEERIDPWRGVIMAIICNEWAQLDRNFGFKLETPPAHPGLVALSIPWRSAAQYRAQMLDAAHLATFIILTRDRDGGRVEVDRQGQPRLHYRLSAYDRQHMLRGVVEAARLHGSQGARGLHLPHYEQGWLDLADTDPGEQVERMAATLSSWNWAPNRFPLFSAHQMGTCRMGGDAERHPLTPAGESREVKGLYVADGSAFPASSGVNPMLSIQAMAHFTAQGMIAGA